MTSNIGSQEILSFQAGAQPPAGRAGSYDRMKETVLGLLRQHFRPEFLNRVDEIIVFHALEQEQIREIAGLLLQRLATRVQQTQGSTLEWDQEAAGYLAKKGYDPAYGARPLKRLIQQEVETPLSRKIIAGEIGPGSTITLKGTPDGLFFEVQDK
jgi:ATP-dependent Clp protease ATP-binding subunit ClpB